MTAALPHGLLVPSSSVGNNKTWLEQADRVILEVNHWQPRELEGFHDIYYGTAVPPHRRPIMITEPLQRIGEPYLHVDPDKVVAVIETDSPDRNAPFNPPDDTSRAIADHLVDFLRPRGPHRTDATGTAADPIRRRQRRQRRASRARCQRVHRPGRVHRGAAGRHARPTRLRHGAGDIGHVVRGSSSDGVRRFLAGIDDYKGRILLRSEEISNHQELVRRLGVLAMNGMIEADIYGNVNSTHVMGSAIMNGIGGSGDFARNAFSSTFSCRRRRPRVVPSRRSSRWSATSTTLSTTYRSS